MTAESIIIIITAVLISNAATLWVMFHMRHQHQEIMRRVFARLNYMEIGMHHHQLIPLPWEAQDLPSGDTETKNFKHQGNVVYLQDK